MTSSRDSSVAGRIASAIDRVRHRVHSRLGTRSYRVFVVTRDWSGGEVGEGTPLVTELELDIPRPLVSLVTRDRLGPGGREQVGDLVLTEVSLRYIADELSPPALDGREVAYKVVDVGGQEQADRFFVLAGEPVSRRGDRANDNADWRIHLTATQPQTNNDGANADT